MLDAGCGRREGGGWQSRRQPAACDAATGAGCRSQGGEELLAAAAEKQSRTRRPDAREPGPAGKMPSRAGHGTSARHELAPHAAPSGRSRGTLGHVPGGSGGARHRLGTSPGRNGREPPGANPPPPVACLSQRAPLPRHGDQLALAGSHPGRSWRPRAFETLRCEPPPPPNTAPVLCVACCRPSRSTGAASI